MANKAIIEIKSVNTTAIKYLEEGLKRELANFEKNHYGINALDQAKALVLMTINGYAKNIELLEKLSQCYFDIPDFAQLVDFVLNYLTEIYKNNIITLKTGRQVDGAVHFTKIKELLKKRCFSYDLLEYLN